MGHPSAAPWDQWGGSVAQGLSFKPWALKPRWGATAGRGLGGETPTGPPTQSALLSSSFWMELLIAINTQKSHFVSPTEERGLCRCVDSAVPLQQPELLISALRGMEQVGGHSSHSLNCCGQWRAALNHRKSFSYCHLCPGCTSSAQSRVTVP